LLAPRPTPIPEGQASVFISPRGRVAIHFSRLLRHAWVTVGLFLFPGHHTAISNVLCTQIWQWYIEPSEPSAMNARTRCVLSGHVRHGLALQIQAETSRLCTSVTWFNAHVNYVTLKLINFYFYSALIRTIDYDNLEGNCHVGQVPYKHCSHYDVIFPSNTVYVCSRFKNFSPVSDSNSN
jgi:hypothetical protein